MRDRCIILSILCAFLFGNCTLYPQDIITIDLTNEYPVLDMKLSDIANVSYIQLKGKDSAIFLTEMHEYDNAIYIDGNYIFISDCFPVEKDIETKTTYVLSDAAHLYLYDINGNFIRSIVKSGTSDNEFFGYGMNFTVHPSSETITIHGTTKDVVQIFDFYGNYKGCRNLGKRYSDNVAFNDKLMFVDYSSQYIMSNGDVKDNGQTLMFYDVNALEQITFPDIHIPAIYSKPGYTTKNKIIRTYSGAYLVTPRTDTIFHIDYNFNISPRFVSIWHDTESDNCLIPIAETSEYVLFSSDIDYISSVKGKLQYKTYLFDKINNQIYLVNSGNDAQGSFETSIFMDGMLLGSCNTTQNPNMLAYVLPIMFLKENYSKLPEKLRHMTDMAADDDNPILMIVKIKENPQDFNNLIKK